MKEENKINTNLEKIEKEIERKKILPQAEMKKIIKKCVINGGILLVILIYLFCLQMGEENLQTETYITILKVLSVVLVIFTIIMFEISYKTNKNEIILHTMEALVISFFTLYLISAYSLYYGSYYKVIIVGATVSTIYYLLKCIIIIKKQKKKYYKSLIDIKKIVAK